MKIAIHQPHFFPWIGYFDKMAKVDQFILLDEVQFEKGSQMIRNKVISNDGSPKYITISADTKGFLNRKYRDIEVKNTDTWTKNHIACLSNYYRKAAFVDEIIEVLAEFYSRGYQTLNEWTSNSIQLIKEMLDISTPIVYQSEIDYDRDKKKSDLVMSICNALHADTYLSGRGGSVGYLDRDGFFRKGITIEFQDFDHPIYKQCNTDSFIPGLSILDLLFNCGIKESKNIFWDCINKKPKDTCF